MTFFKSEEVVITDCPSAFEDIKMHIEKNEKLKTSLYVSVPSITFKKKENELSDDELKVIINPKIEEMCS